MKNILSPGNRQVLAQFAFSNVLLAFDYDGTLAPIVADPRRAAMRPATRALLGDVARLYPCVVISGRARADTRSRLDGIELRGVVGNHGAEALRVLNGHAHEVARWRTRLEAMLEGEPGVKIEDKGHSLAIHYRGARKKRRAREQALRAASSLSRARLVGGKQVLNVVPADAPHKGDALERERARLRCDTAVYVGDDETDEDVFRLDQPGRLLTIRVGARRGSEAAYCVRDQRQIDALLRALVGLRSER